MSAIPPQASARLVSRGTTANQTESHEKWQADLEASWSRRIAPAISRLDERGRAMRRRAAGLARVAAGLDRSIYLTTHSTLAQRRVRVLRSAQWAEERARAASLTRAAILSTCRKRWRRVGCGCSVQELPVGCELVALCDWCRARHWRRWRRRITRAMGAHARAARDHWHRAGRRGSAPSIYLVTLTMPHSGDIVRDREVMGRAWRVLSKAASYGQWWGHHALVYEVTRGRDGLGHVHAHVAALSSWIPFAELRAIWARAIPGATQVDVVTPTQARQRAKAAGRRFDPASNSGQYLAKYVTKGCDPREFTGEKAGELLAAFRGRRKVTTSKHFWRPTAQASRTCKKCGGDHRLLAAPASLQTLIPGAILAGWVVRSPRWGPRQGALRLTSST